MTAKKTLLTLSSLIATSLPPVPGQESGVEGRQAAVAASFAQLAEIGGDLPLTEADVWVAFSRLGSPMDGDTPPVLARRLTCRQVAGLVSVDPPLGGALDMARTSLNSLATVMETLVANFQGSSVPPPSPEWS